MDDVVPEVRSGEAAAERDRAAAVIVDTADAAHEQLDRITRLARKLFRVDATSITLLDARHAWLPSAQGLPTGTVPRRDTFCDTTQSLGDLMVVSDARQDERFRALPLVAGGDVVFYAGHPLKDHLGNVVGTLCLFHGSSRELDDEERADLADLAAWAEHELVSSNEMGQARQVQSALFPTTPVERDGWLVDGFCLPALAVGGDCFDYGVGGGVLHLGVGDVMGKGTSAALLGAGARSAVRATHQAVTAGADLGVVTTQVARSLLPDLEGAGAFLTLFQAAVDLDDGYTRWIDAGAGLAAIVRAEGGYEVLAGEDRPFGVLPDDHWSEHTTSLEPGDRLVVVSDGILDVLDDPLDPWPELERAVRRCPRPADLLEDVRGMTTRRAPLDDVTVLAVYRCAS